jgi:hypothetical protein
MGEQPGSGYEKNPDAHPGDCTNAPHTEKYCHHSSAIILCWVFATQAGKSGKRFANQHGDDAGGER